MNNNINNENIIYNDNLNANSNTDNLGEQQNIEINEGENNIQIKILSKNNELKNETDNNSDFQDNPINSNKEEHNEEEYIQNKKEISNHDSEIPKINQVNPEQINLNVDQLASSDINQSFIKNDKKIINSPKLINPLDSRIMNSPLMNNDIPSQKAESENGEILSQNQEEEKNNSFDFNREEEKYLRNKEEYKKKQFNF
jgi:hypothetical protein